ncbi:glycosyltransferase family 4 protein [Alkalitalea saponilacus]|uniref:Glycosyltransferase involved in cell wall bisynthesis n=1 Tax=Alkalitalea saponilacus TaxID=889453 RepID=A0A1T5HS69_9BACT|nr:glycosyltransferase family 4 protein [Alkalitalea saponilacus]ASB48302.1 glycosyl transferase family 1 [Alkalitalea saponilacus]SKC23525.1 Glycosyltransferase involved in cell wall bisynthesis [Alkalitalea saponilacus]
MHICFLSHEYPIWATGGIGTFIQTTGRALVTAGHQVSVVGIGYKDEEEVFNDEGVEVYRLAYPRFLQKRGRAISRGWVMRKQVLKIHQQNPIDIIETPEAGLYYWFGRQPFVKVVRMHGGHHFFAESENREVKWGRGMLEKISFRNADAFIAVSKYVKSHTAKYLSTGKKPVEVIRLSINDKLFRQADHRKTIKHRLVFAGTVCEKKGIRHLLMALHEVIEKFPNVHLDVYGRDWSYPDGTSYTATLKRTFKEDVLSHVTFHGSVKLSEIPDKYEEAELCVFPSLMETQGLVAPEAMVMGKPVLFSNTGPGMETIEHMVTGLLCNPYEPKDISRQIVFAFEHPERMVEIAKAGQRFAQKTFNLSEVTEQNVDFFHRLCKLR